MGAGEFQSLCDAFLYKIGYENIVRLGSDTGTNKTTKGTPDTWNRCADGKYVFAEYTTQTTGIAKKIMDDLKKCFDEEYTKVPVSSISKIIYCHTSSNLEPGDDLTLHQTCADKGIELDIYGIDQITYELYFKHPDLAKRFLNIQLDTDQICEYERFIELYDSNRLAAPLSTPFLGRETEMTEIENAFSSVKVVVLTGPAGVGKSRVALEYAQRHIRESHQKLFCIRDNAQPIYEELKMKLNHSEEYFLFVDDANELSGFRYVLPYVTDAEKDVSVTLLVTVRDYAKGRVISEIKECAEYRVIEIPPFADEQIISLVRDNYGIQNDECLSRIVHIAEGNARIAMLAGKIAKETNRMDSISDLSQLYEDYYGKALKTNGIRDNREELICMGIAAVLSPFSMTKTNAIDLLLQGAGITKETFAETMQELHKKEFVEIHFNDIVRFSEQCLNNYILKLVFIDEQYIHIRDLVRCCFGLCRGKIIDAINTMLALYQVKEVRDTIENELRELWNEYEMGDEQAFHEYVKAFFRINPTGALLYIQNQIDSMETTCDRPSHDVIEKEKNHKNIDDDYLEILGGFADSEGLDTALDIMFLYYLKRPDRMVRFYHLITSKYGIQMYSVRNKYYTQMLLIDKFCEYSDDWNNEHIVNLFLEIAPVLLKTEHSYSEPGRKSTYNFYTISLPCSHSLMKYRNRLWDALTCIAKNGYNRELLASLFSNYPGHYDNKGRVIINAEANKSVAVAAEVLSPENVKHCVWAARLKRRIRKTDKAAMSKLKPLIHSKLYQVYRMLSGTEEGYLFSKRMDRREQRVRQYIQKHALAGMMNLINVGKQIDGQCENDWSMRAGMEIAFDELKKNGMEYVQAIEYYMTMGAPLHVSIQRLVFDLYEVTDLHSIKDLIFLKDYPNKQDWQYAYFAEMPKKMITPVQAKELMEFFNEQEHWNETNCSYRNVSIVEKYCDVAEGLFVHATEMIVEKTLGNRPMLAWYYSPMFQDRENEVPKIINLFGERVDLLEMVFMTALRYGHSIDYDGHILMEIIKRYPQLIHPYAEYVGELADRNNESHVMSQVFALYALENANDLLDIILSVFMKTKRYYQIREFIKMMISPEQSKEDLVSKQDSWIKHIIQSHKDDTAYMAHLFEPISYLDNGKRIEYIKYFMERNSDYEMFTHIPLVPYSYSWTGSAVPVYAKQRDFLMELLPHLTGIRYLRHKQLVEKIIESLEKDIQNEQIQDILEKV